MSLCTALVVPGQITPGPEGPGRACPPGTSGCVRRSPAAARAPRAAAPAPPQPSPPAPASPARSAP